MNRNERRLLVQHASTLTNIGRDLATGRLESDQVSKWLRILSMEVQMNKEIWLHAATLTWLPEEREALRQYREGKS